MTRGGVSALIVPISGTVTWKSDRISSRYASNSSSARSISSMSRTGATPSVASSAWRSGRRIRKSAPKMSWAVACSASPRASSSRISSIWRG